MRSILPGSGQIGSGVPALKCRNAISSQTQDLRGVGQGMLPCPERELSSVTTRSHNRKFRLPEVVAMRAVNICGWSNFIAWFFKCSKLTLAFGHTMFAIIYER